VPPLRITVEEIIWFFFEKEKTRKWGGGENGAPEITPKTPPGGE
jgi:hypothetical protein